MTFLRIFYILPVLLLFQCSNKAAQTESLRAKANELAQKFIITDGHVDLPYRLRIKNFTLDKQYTGIPIKSSEGDFDFERARQGGLDAPFMSIYIPSKYQLQPDN